MPAKSESVRSDRYDRFRVDRWLDLLGGFAARRPHLLRRLGDWETKHFSEELGDVKIRAPIFVCGLARSGSTILLECLASHPETATHRYRDFPGVLAPIIWDRMSSRLYDRGTVLAERAHGDGIAVTPDSPEAIEEMIWMAFYPEAHEPTQDNRMRRGGVTAEFAAYYRDHIRKLLWLRDGSRYLSKGNYNLVRLEGLIDIFPDARFIIPVRDPVTHVASLMRQHALFSNAMARHPAALRYMQHVGHFEFGLDRRPLNLGDDVATARIQNLWREGRELEGWSHYWAGIHDFVAEQLTQHASLKTAALVVRFEELCADPERRLQAVFAHAGLALAEQEAAGLARRIRAPDYYKLPFTEAEQQTIRDITAQAAARLGYQAIPGNLGGNGAG